MKVTFELTTEEFKQLFGVSVVNNVPCELRETGLQPDWDDAPDWADYWAADKDGEAYFYEKLPYTGDWEWLISEDNDGRVRYDSEFRLNGTDWKTTLRKRP